MANNFQVDRNKNKKSTNVFRDSSASPKKTQTKTEKFLEGVDIWTSFYRSNPHRFAKDYLGIQLKMFQIILINMMMINHYFMYLASRGQGKSWLISVFCIIRAILFPGSKIIVAAGQKSQAQEILVYIDTMRKECPNLNREIESCKPTSSTDPTCHFHNGSWIRVVAATDGARSKRSNILIIDEFRMVKLDVINKVLRKFQTAPRQPKYLQKPEYAHLQERNKEFYLSSCWYQSHWSWDKVRAYFKKITDKKEAPYFMCGLPYQLAIKENLLMREQVMDEMSEDDFDEIGWSMEMGCLFFGESESAYFKFDDVSSNRTLLTPVYPSKVYDNIKLKNFKRPKKSMDVIRFIVADIALMAGKQNDASAYAIFELKPNKTGYIRKIIYMESMVGGHTNTQSVRIMQLFKDYECDYIVLDCMGNGMGIYDQLCQGAIDRVDNVEYEPYSCMNDENMAERCVDSEAEKIIYSIKASAKFNSDIAKSLKDNLKRNKIKILINENDAKQGLYKLNGYEKLPIEDKAILIAPYAQASILLNEMVNLENEGKDGVVKLKEPRNGRKDRFSCVAYGNEFASYLERIYLKKDVDNSWVDYLVTSGASYSEDFY